MFASEIHQKYYSNIPDDCFVKIISADTVSSNLQKNKIGKYAKWLLNLYQRKCLKIEDLYKAKEYIAVFDKSAKMNKLADIDLNHYKSLPQMYMVIKPLIKVKSKTERVQRIKEKEARKLYEDDTFVVIHPLTRAASCLYGKGTQWCTAARRSNCFYHYNFMGDLYIIINKRNGKKYQFHPASENFMNEEDEPVDFFINGEKNQDGETYTLQRINAIEGVFRYLCTEMPRLHYEYINYLLFHTLSDSEYAEIVSNVEFRIVQLKSAKAWFVLWAKPTYSGNYYESQYDYKNAIRKMGKIYLFEDFKTGVRSIVSEKLAGFLSIYHEEIREIKVEITPKLDDALIKLKIHPEWKMYCELFNYKAQINKNRICYIVRKESYYSLYNADFEEVLDKTIGAENIIPFKDIIRRNELIIIKNNHKGIYYIDTDTIHWGYKGVVDEEEVDWIRRV